MHLKIPEVVVPKYGMLGRAPLILFSGMKLNGIVGCILHRSHVVKAVAYQRKH